MEVRQGWRRRTLFPGTAQRQHPVGTPGAGDFPGVGGSYVVVIIESCAQRNSPIRVWWQLHLRKARPTRPLTVVGIARGAEHVFHRNKRASAVSMLQDILRLRAVELDTHRPLHPAARQFKAGTGEHGIRGNRFLNHFIM